MNFIYEENRIYFRNSDGIIIAEVTFPYSENNTVDINHTFVDNSLRGQGIADKLLTAAADYLDKNNKKVKLSCSYAISWFHKHSEYSHLIV